MVEITQLDPPVLPGSTGQYTHGVLVAGGERTVYVSGQVPWGDEDGRIPPDFESQCRMVWRNVLAVLGEAGMDARNLVKVNTYLSDRQYRAENAKIRAEVLGDHAPALTIVICDIYAEEWLLEIEAIAVA
ncbi:RidA family protein [Kribbella sandramycini]|uniref:Enamine deaminase RidA (YjgF/YER057c/UK114 family) n=1 Tax=Kribbella sandramycini TaxID=60450 RepID=A0A7Y4L0I1_9ACTN|nr:RidA family protein [Kribbella sandramycini]MBB6565796.1 enamine deaminase RidA (YjgF/YER057c/UK114 family) [Kribbella sandramycini]NOL42060.1 RidA family protein [Kribbella sandramycini]